MHRIEVKKKTSYETSLVKLIDGNVMLDGQLVNELTIDEHGVHFRLNTQAIESNISSVGVSFAPDMLRHVCAIADQVAIDYQQQAEE